MTHYSESSKRLSTTGSPVVNRLVQTTQEAGYHPFNTAYSHTHINTDTLYPYIHAHKSDYTFIFTGSHNIHTMVVSFYAYKQANFLYNNKDST